METQRPVLEQPDWITSLVEPDELPRTNEEIGAALRTVAEVAGRLGGLPLAAATTDHAGKLIAINVDQRLALHDRSTHAARVVMVNTLRLLGAGVINLGDITLHILSGSNIESIGQIWLFAPKRVVIHSVDSDQTDPNLVPAHIPVCEDFWSQAKEVRGIEVSRMPLNENTVQDLAKIEAVVTAQQGSGLNISTLAKEPYPRPAWITELGVAFNKVYAPDELMRLLHVVAKENVQHGGGPFAAAVVNQVGCVVELNVNMVVPFRDCGAHAEKVAAANACYLLGQDTLKGCTVYSSSAPCIGCSEQLTHLCPDCVVSGVPKERVEAQSGFQEGPVKDGYWKEVEGLYGIKRIEKFLYDTEQSHADEPFEAFNAAVKKDPSRAYLEKCKD
ncbi:nucleoside deaminase [Oligoflexia bacterium]|nr:nucleoside deaminase [Oligoflexia bacterium]